MKYNIVNKQATQDHKHQTLALDLSPFLLKLSVDTAEVVHGVQQIASQDERRVRF